MNIRLKNPNTDMEYPTTLPCDEKKLQDICGKLGIENTAYAEVYVTAAYLGNEDNPLLKDNLFNLDELNYLLKRLDSFGDNETNTFYAVGTALKYTTAKDLINLTFNTHCYSLVDDFSDLNKLGESLHINEQGSISMEDLRDFDGQKYIQDMISSNPTPLTSPYGFVYPNSNTPLEEYNGITLPAYWWKENPITLSLATDVDIEYLYLPISDNELTKALQRLDVEHILDCVVEIENDLLPESISNIIFEDASLPNLNEFAKKLDDIGFHEYTRLVVLIEYTKVSAIPDLKLLIDCYQEFETFDNIHSPSDYGLYMICESGRFEYDENLESYIDFKGYGENKVQGETGAFTGKGYVLYHGFNKDMEQILHKNIGIEFKQQTAPQELLLYMPLRVTSYQDENSYGDMDTVDYEVEIENSDALNYFEEIADALEKENLSIEEKRGLMAYYSDNDSINAKVQSYRFGIEEVDGELMGVAILKLNAELTPQEFEKIKQDVTGQASDGYCEGFEQRDIDVSDRKINVHFWDSDDWYLKTAEELGIVEQKHEMGGMSL